MTESIGKMFDRFMNLSDETGSVKELEFRGTSPCIPGRCVGMNYIS